MTDRYGRGRRAYRNAAEAICAPRWGAICWLCREPIEYGLRPRHPRGPSLDHIVPLNQGGSLLDPANHALAHYGCNTARHDRPAPLGAGLLSNPSTQW